jgi:hypothetical protein
MAATSVWAGLVLAAVALVALADAASPLTPSRTQEYQVRVAARASDHAA